MVIAWKDKVIISSGDFVSGQMDYFGTMKCFFLSRKPLLQGLLQCSTPKFSTLDANVFNNDELALVGSALESPVASFLGVIYASLIRCLKKLCTPAEWFDMLASVMVLLILC